MLQSVQIPQAKFSQPQVRQSCDTDDPVRPDLFIKAIQTPIEFPRLEEVIFGGDRIALALLSSVQDPIQSIRSILIAMTGINAQTEISVVASPRLANDFARLAELEKEELFTSHKLDFQLHDPTDQNAVACIANSESGDAIYVNRTLFDADIVIPIGLFVPDELTIGSSVYPEFSCVNTLQRYHDQTVPLKQLRNEKLVCDQHLGADFSILMVAGPGGQIRDVYAGRHESIRAIAIDQSQDCWSVRQQADGQVVIATIESNPEHQTWEHLFQAIMAASAASCNAQRLVICTEIRDCPTPRYHDILQLQFESDYDTINRRLESASDLHRNIPAILTSTTVYLQSHLERADVEELGLGFIESDAEIQTIVDHAESGVVLRDAHLCNIK